MLFSRRVQHSQKSDRPGVSDLFKKWFLEWLALLGSGLVLLILAAVLRRFDGHVITDWPLGLSLNTFISLLTTILWMLLTGASSTAISQLKWSHFSSVKRPLYHFHRVDQASRGVFGSLVLLSKGPWTVVLLIASVTTIAIAGIGPLVQSVLDIELTELPVPGEAWISISNTSFAWPVEPGHEIRGAHAPFGSLVDAFPSQENKRFINSTTAQRAVSDLYVPEGAFRAVLTGAFSVESTPFVIDSNCTSANCSWPYYQTLAFEHRCENLTDHLILNNDINSTVSRMFQQLDIGGSSNTTVTTSDDGIVNKTLHDTFVIGLAHGMNLSMANFVSIEDVQRAHLSDGKQPVFGRRSFVMTPYKAPISVKSASGTVLLMQSIYAETLIDKSGWYYGRMFGFECAINLVAENLLSHTRYGDLNEELRGSRVRALGVPKGSMGARDIVIRDHELRTGPSASGDRTDNSSFPGCQLWLDKGLSTSSTNFVSCNSRTSRSNGTEASPSYLNFTHPQFPPAHSNYSFDPYAAISLATTLARVFQGADHDYGWAENPINKQIGYNPSDQLLAVDGTFTDLSRSVNPFLSNALLITANQVRPDPLFYLGERHYTLNGFMKGVADSLSFYLRRYTDQRVYGTPLVTTAIYVVYWNWLAVPGTLIALSVILVVFTAGITHQRNVPLYKDSGIAPTVRGPSGDLHEKLLEFKDPTRLHKFSKVIKVRLDPNAHVLTDAETTAAMPPVQDPSSPPPEQSGESGVSGRHGQQGQQERFLPEDPLLDQDGSISMADLGMSASRRDYQI